MTTIPSPAVLVDRVFPRTRVTDVVSIAAGAVIIGLLAQVAIPLWPVPVTGQTLAIILVAGSLGTWRGLSSIGVYVALGAVGVPWFSEASGGWHVLMGPTAGYILGFFIAGAIVGRASDRGLRRLSWKTLLVYSAASAIVFIPGIAWLALSLGLDLPQALNAGLYPFVLGGVIKAVVAAALMPALWAGAEKLRPRQTDLSGDQQSEGTGR